MRRMLYGFLSFGVLALLIVAAVAVGVEARWRAVVPTVLAIVWVRRFAPREAALGARRRRASGRCRKSDGHSSSM